MNTIAGQSAYIQDLSLDEPGKQLFRLFDTGFVYEVGFIYDYNVGNFLLLKESNKFPVCKDEYCQVGPVHNSSGPPDSLLPQRALVIKSGRINDHYRTQRQQFHRFDDRISRRAPDVGYHGDLLTRHGVHNAGLSGISPAEESNVHSFARRRAVKAHRCLLFPHMY